MKTVYIHSASQTKMKRKKRREKREWKVQIIRVGWGKQENI